MNQTYLQPQRVRHHHRIWAILLSIALLWDPSVLLGNISTAAHKNLSKHQSSNIEKKLSVPAKLGSVDQVIRGTSEKTLIYIKDAHDSMEVQENIAKLIHHYVSQNEVNTVYEEAYHGRVPTDEFFSFNTRAIVPCTAGLKIAVPAARTQHPNRNG